MNVFISKLHSRRGLTRKHLIFIILDIVLLVLIAIPGIKAYKTRADELGCLAALDTAWRQIRNELIFDFGEEQSVKDAQEVLARAMPERYRDSLCPAGGTIYLIRDGDGGFTPVCGLHDPDTKERTRLNASYAKGLLEEELFAMKVRHNELGESVAVSVNSAELECVLADQIPEFRLGTKYTKGYKGVVAFCGVDEDYELLWFLYADEEHYACWDGEVWSGDSYVDR